MFAASHNETPQSIVSPKEKRILCVWIPNWPIQRITKSQPDLKKHPLALYEHGPRGGLRIGFTSFLARKNGIQAGIPVADATARLGSRLRIIKHDPIADKKELIQLAIQCHEFSPHVGLIGMEHCDTLLFDITGSSHLFGGEEKLVQQVWQQFRSWQLFTRMATAKSVGAAWAFAHCDARSKPGPFVCQQNTPIDLANELGTLPLNSLRLTAKTLQTLSELGLETVGQILTLPRNSLVSRFPSELLQRVDQALGKLEEPIVALNPPQEFVAEWDFFYPTQRQDAIFIAIAELSDRLAKQLHQENRGALEITCKMTCEPKSTFLETVKFYRPVCNAQHFLELIELKLEQARLPASIVNITLKATRHSLATPRQKELFADRTNDYAEEFSLLVNQLTSRLGEKAVVCPLLCANSQPELAFREEPLISRRSLKSSFAYRFSALQRPTILFPRPLPLEVTAVFPDGPPQGFVRAGKNYRITRKFGPERIETGWWGKKGIRRDYYCVETSCGAWYWIFRSISSRKWFLHGEFA